MAGCRRGRPTRQFLLRRFAEDRCRDVAGGEAVGAPIDEGAASDPGRTGANAAAGDAVSGDGINNHVWLSSHLGCRFILRNISHVCSKRQSGLFLHRFGKHDGPAVECEGAAPRVSAWPDGDVGLRASIRAGHETGDTHKSGLTQDLNLRPQPQETSCQSVCAGISLAPVCQRGPFGACYPGRVNADDAAGPAVPLPGHDHAGACRIGAKIRRIGARHA